MCGLSLLKKVVLACLCITVLAPVRSESPDAGQEVTTTVDVTAAGAPIHPYVYGMFTELLGNIFEKGLWAEMLSDRKFFYPVDTSSTLTPRDTRRNQNRWRPVGGADVVVMDREFTFFGEGKCRSGRHY